MDELNDMQNTVHEYRKALDAFARRTGAPTQSVEVRGSGEEREKIARMDADLTAIEERAQLQQLQARLAKLESQPMFESRAPKAAQLGDENDRGSEAYAKRWLNAVIRGDAAEMRALSTGTSGAAIPTDLERRIVGKLREANVLRSMCPISNIDSKRTITVEGNLPTTAIVDEAGSISASDPSFATAISVAPRKFVTRVTMSQEFIEDAIGDGGIGSGLQYVADKCGLSIGLKQEQMYTIGDPAAATPQPQGIAHSSALAAFGSNYVDLGTSAALSTLTGDNLIDAVHKVSPAYRNSPRFSWLISDEFLKTVRKIKTAAGSSEYVWRPVEGGLGLTGGAPGTIYGVPYRIGQYLPTVGSTNDTVYGVVGDFNYFEIFDRTGITTMMDPYSAAATHQVNMYVYTRTDSKVMNGSAFCAVIS